MLNDADAELFDVIVVHKLDRFARNLRVTLETLDHLGRFKVSFASINENMDFSTPIGKVILATLGCVCSVLLRQLVLGDEEGQAANESGKELYNGLASVRREEEQRRNPGSQTPRLTKGSFSHIKTAADGKSDRKAAQVLNDHGYRIDRQSRITTVLERLRAPYPDQSVLSR